MELSSRSNLLNLIFPRWSLKNIWFLFLNCQFPYWLRNKRVYSVRQRHVTNSLIFCSLYHVIYRTNKSCLFCYWVLCNIIYVMYLPDRRSSHSQNAKTLCGGYDTRTSCLTLTRRKTSAGCSGISPEWCLIILTVSVISPGYMTRMTLVWLTWPRWLRSPPISITLMECPR